MNPNTCLSCGAPTGPERACQDDFYQMLYWENEDAALGVVHHLTVLCYHLQHPQFYSPAGLRHALGLLDAFIHGATPAEVRAATRGQVASGTRKWTVTARPGAQGSYPQPVPWRMSAFDVVAAGKSAYIDTVRAWAQSVYDDLGAAGNLTSPPDHQT